MNLTDLAGILSAFSPLRVGVLGDFALDCYIGLETETGEQSIETGKPVHYGREIRSSPGAAGTIVNNLKALGIRQIYCFGWLGQDLFGRELRYLLAKSGVDTQGLIDVKTGFETYVYLKPLEGGVEASRIDFGTQNKVEVEAVNRVLSVLEDRLPDLDVLIINQQFKESLAAAHRLEVLGALLLQYPDCQVISDLRTYAGQLKTGIVKGNVGEIARMLGLEKYEEQNTEKCRSLAKKAFQQLGQPLLMTRGENGLLYIDSSGIYEEPGIALTGTIDVVGAGDACLSAFAAGTGCAAPMLHRLKIANLAAAITVQKINETGTANPAEILDFADRFHYQYHLDKAHDLSSAMFLGSSKIEIVESLPANRDIRSVMFDHDGTLSTLREGWERIMQELMMEMICGDKQGSLNTSEKAALTAHIQGMIDQTTGFPTIMQMEAFVEMIPEVGYVAHSEILTAEAYKSIFLERLMNRINDRVQGLKAGEIQPGEFIMAGAEQMMENLALRGIALYLASGTDEEEVKKEARLLGYADRFGEEIYGARSHGKDAKRTLLSRLVGEEGYEGRHLLVIGDGPAEMREGRRAGALCIGIASDEVSRKGINPAKRNRLIRAGAHVIISDYLERDILLDTLFPHRT